MRRTARPLAPAIPALLALLAPLLVATCSGNAVTTSSAAPSTGSSASPVSTPLASPATPTLSLQPSSTPTTAPTEDPSPRPSGTPVAIGALRWEPLDGLPEIGYPRDLVGFAAGYLLVGEEGVFFSPDARTWTAVRLPVATSAIEHEGWSVVTDGRVAVVVGTETIPPCIGDGSAPGDTGGGGDRCWMRPVAWRTTDGRTWSRSLAWPTPSIETDAYRAMIATAWAIPGGGWAALLWSVSGVANTPIGVFRSSDARAWSGPAPRLPGQGQLDEALDGWGPGAADAAGRSVVGQSFYSEDPGLADERTVLRSATVGATRWSPVAGIPTADWAAILAPGPATDGRWRVAGTLADGELGWAEVWSSSDLATWTIERLPTGTASGAELADLALTGWGEVAVGRLADEEGGRLACSWARTPGEAWTLVPVAGEADAGGPELIADGPAGLLGISSPGQTEAGDDRPAGAWLLR